MPYRKKYRKKPRTYRRPKISKLLTDKKVAKLAYVDTYSINPAIDGITSQVFRANGCHDPDYSNNGHNGHQPLLWDQYKLMYNQYRVLACKIKVTPTSSNTSVATPALYGVYSSPNLSLDYSSGTQIIEDFRVKGPWRTVSGAYASLNKHARSITTYFNAKRQMDPEGYNNTTIVTSDPASGNFDWTFHVWAAAINGNDPGAFEFLAEIEYTIEFSDPVVIAQS